MKRRNSVRVISFCAAAVLAVSGYAVKIGYELYRMRLEAENNYSQSLSRLGTGINNISVLLEKARYVITAKQLSHTATQLLTEAEASKTALSALPSYRRSRQGRCDATNLYARQRMAAKCLCISMP